MPCRRTFPVWVPDQKVAGRAGQSGDGHAALRMLKSHHIDRDGFCPAETEDQHHKQPDRIQMFERIQRQASCALCSIIAEQISHITVRQLMQGDAKERWNDAEKYAYQISEIKSIPYCAKCADCPLPQAELKFPAVSGETGRIHRRTAHTPTGRSSVFMPNQRTGNRAVQKHIPLQAQIDSSHLPLHHFTCKK